MKVSVSFLYSALTPFGDSSADKVVRSLSFQGQEPHLYLFVPNRLSGGKAPSSSCFTAPAQRSLVVTS